MRPEVRNVTGDVEKHEERWQRILDQWVKVTGNSDSIMIGDLNLDKINWQNPDQNISNMVEATKNSIEVKGFQTTDRGTHQKLETAEGHMH